MPIWVSDYWTRFLKFMGLSNDSTRPNTGAFVLLAAMMFMATKFTPDPYMDFWQNAEALLKAVGETAAKTDNLIGLALGYLGLRQIQPPSA